MDFEIEKLFKKSELIPAIIQESATGSCWLT